MSLIGTHIPKRWFGWFLVIKWVMDIYCCLGWLVTMVFDYGQKESEKRLDSESNVSRDRQY